MSDPEGSEEENDVDFRVVKEVTMDGGEVNFGDADGEVSGDVMRGNVVRGEGHLTVKGNVLGDPRGRCEIDIAETVVLEQNV